LQAKLIVTMTCGALLCAPSALAFESAKTLPAGVRNLDVRTVNTRIEEKTNGDGKAIPLAEPLAQQLTFDKIAKGEDELKAQLLRAFLLDNGFQEDDVVGEFSADLNAAVSVVAPIFGYGITENLTLAVAVPYYRATTKVEVGFTPNATAQRFLDALATTENNQTAAAREAGDKLNNAVARLNSKLADNGYRELEDWEGRGIGDVTLAAKHRAFDNGLFAFASTTGVVLPTGRVDNPDILTDLAFGDGQWDVFGQLITDESLGGGFLVNQHAKYTAQLPGRKVVREATFDEAIEVQQKNTRFKLGDKIDAGASLQWTPRFGLISGIGYTYFKKYGDRYTDVDADAKAKLQDETDQESHNREAVLGYSTVPHYQSGAFGLPVELKLTYTSPISSKNLPVSDLYQVDFNLFF